MPSRVKCWWRVLLGDTDTLHVEQVVGARIDPEERDFENGKFIFYLDMQSPNY